MRIWCVLTCVTLICGTRTSVVPGIFFTNIARANLRNSIVDWANFHNTKGCDDTNLVPGMLRVDPDDYRAPAPAGYTSFQ